MKRIRFRRLPGASFYLAALLLLAGVLQSAAQVVTKILDQGDNSKQINIVIFSEGYTSTELTTKFTTDAQKLLNAFFETEPYKEYKSFFNAYTIAVASTDSGSDHYTPSLALRNTYFNSTYDSFGIQRLLTIPPNDRNGNYADGQGKVNTLLMNYVPDYDLIMMVVNDPIYGGSGGNVSITSTEATAPEVLIHEAGHTFANLGDEYSSAFPGYPDVEEPNTTKETRRGFIKWSNWISPSTPIPTPDLSLYGNVVGLFQGAHYQTTGWYRPKRDCKMRTLGVDFCEVCKEAVVLSIYADVSPIDSFSPAETSLSALIGANLDFVISKKKPGTRDLALQWSVDGLEVPGATGDRFSTAILGIGQHTVSARVVDSTSLVRTDSQNRLARSQTWNVKIMDPAAVTYSISGKAAPASKGSISGSGRYPVGKLVTLKAVPKKTRKFVSWTENKKVVSKKAVYKFLVTKNRVLIANFK